MMIFEITDKGIKPLAPGFKTVDDVKIFDVPGAARHTGRPESFFVELYKAAFADSMPNETITGESMGQPGTGDRKFALVLATMSEDQKDELIRLMLYPRLPAKVFQAFKLVAQQRGLSIFCRHLYPEYRIDGGEMKLVIVTTIEALRVLARRCMAFKGVPKIQFKGENGEWTDAWNAADGPPAFAKAIAYRDGDPYPTERVVAWAEYRPMIKTELGLEVDPFWQRFAAKMLGKCAEADATRACAPEETNGIYTVDEMRQRDNFQPTAAAAPVVSPPGTTYEADSQLSSDEESQVTDYIEADEFQSLLDSVIPDEQQQREAIVSYKVKYRRIYAQSPAKFHTLMAADLRQLRDQPPS